MRKLFSASDFPGEKMITRTTRKGAAVASAVLCLSLPAAFLALHTGCASNSNDYDDPAPNISSFTVSPRTIQAGTTAPISFRANFAVKDGSAVITPGNFPVVSNVPLNVPPPTTDTTYTLTVTSSAGKKATATVEVGILGMTTSLDALGKIIAGSTGNTASVPAAPGRTFLWTVTNGSLSSGDATANQITFTAGTSGSVSLSCTVTDPALPGTTTPVVTPLGKSLPIFAPIVFDQSNYAIMSPATAVASYTVDSTVTGFSLTELPSGPVVTTRDTTTAKTGSINLSPAVTTSYRASVTGSNPTYTYSTDFQVTVTSLQPAVVETLTPSSSLLTIDAANLQAQQASNAKSTLSWTLSGDAPTTLTLNGQNVTGTSKEVIPTNRQTFTLSASNAANITPSTKQTSVAVRGLNLLAGSMGGTGMRDGVGTHASFQRPQNMCVAGNFLYVADTYNHIIRKIDLTTKQVTTIAGAAGISGATDVSNGDPLTARFNSPRGIAVDAQGYVWVADGSNNVLRVISPDNKYVYTVSGWIGTTVYTGTSTFGGPQHLFVNNDGTTCTAYLATYNGTLLQLNITGLGSTTTPPAASLSKTFIINGTAAGSNSSVGGCAMVTVGSTPVLFVPDTVADTIKACYLDGSGNPQVVNVTPASPTLVDPASVAATVTGTMATVFVANKHSIVRYAVDLSTVPASAPTVAAGTPVVVGSGAVGVADGSGDAAAFGGPQGLALNGSTLYVAEGSYQWSSSPNIYSNCIRAIAAATTASANTGMAVSTFAGVNRAAAYAIKIPATGTSTGTDARFKTPGHVSVDAIGNTYLADRGNTRIVMIAPDGTTSNFPSDGTTWTAVPLAAVPDASATPAVYVIESGSAALKKFSFGSATPSTLTLTSTFTAVNQAVYFKSGADEYLFTVDGSGKSFKRIELTGASAGTVTTVYTTTGSGLFGLAMSPSGIAYLTEGSRIISIPALNPTTPTTIAGALTTYGFVDGAGASALFNYPGALAYGTDGAQGYVYVVDGRNSALRMITLGATNPVSTLIGRFNGTTSTSSPFYTSALLGILPGLLEPDTTPSTKGLAGSLTISTLTTQGLAVTPAGDLMIISCDSVMQLTAPLNK
jgi:hypothetical protein